MKISKSRSVDQFAYSNIILELKGVSILYKKKMVLKNVSFKLRQHESIAFIGHEQKHLIHLYRFINHHRYYELDAGEIFIHGEKETFKNITKKLKICNNTEQTLVSNTSFITVGERLVKLQKENSKFKKQLAVFKMLSLNQNAQFHNLYYLRIDKLSKFAYYIHTIMEKAIQQPNIITLDERMDKWTPIEEVQLAIFINNLQREYGISFLIFSQNIFHVINVVDSIGVFFKKTLIEYGTANELAFKPIHYETLVRSMVIDRNTTKYFSLMDYNHDLQPPTIYLSDTHFIKTWIFFNAKTISDIPEEIRENL